MNVLIVGNGRRGTLEQFYADAFVQVGHSVRIWDPRSWAEGTFRGKFSRRVDRYVPVESWRRSSSAELLRLCRSNKFDLVLTIATSGVAPGTMEQLKVLAPDTHLYCLYPDSPHNVSVERANALSAFDRVFVSSRAWIPAFRRMGARTVSFIPFAGEVQPPLAAIRQQRASVDLAFVGNWRPEREQTLDPLVPLGLRIWGEKYWKTRTPKDSRVSRAWSGHSALGEDFAHVVRNSRISLNLYDAISWPGPNMRTFELPGYGGFQLSERSEGVLEFFVEGETVECFSSIDEAKDEIEFYLGNDARREKIARASFDLVQRHHTYSHRVREIAALVAQ